MFASRLCSGTWRTKRLAGLVVSRLRDRKKSRRRGTGDFLNPRISGVRGLPPSRRKEVAKTGHGRFSQSENFRGSWSPAFATGRSREDGAREIFSIREFPGFVVSRLRDRKKS